MDQETLKNLLSSFLALSAETEWLEFKSATEKMDIDEIGKYFSALSNAANVKERDRAWLILGINNKRQIVGTSFRNSISGINDLKMVISAGTGGASFIEVHQYFDPIGGRVLFFEIAPAPRGVPMKWKGITYGREGESLVLLGDTKTSIILAQDQNDWSGRKCLGATVSDLDHEAIMFLKRRLAEVGRKRHYLTMDNTELLNRLGLLSGGIPVNTALILLGKQDSVNRLMTDRAKVSWKYSDEASGTTERASFEAPLINKLDMVLNKVNRFNVHLKEGTLFRQNIKQYDELALRELLVNALAHRDWSISLWVEIKQSPGEISFVNPGIFRADLMAAIENNDRPPYLNKKMADILQKIGLMEREGGGLRKVYEAQLQRGARVSHKFNEKATPSVEFVLHGSVEDPKFAQLVLDAQEEINFSDLLVLDQIRSGRNKVGTDIPVERIVALRDKGYIETTGGRSQRAHISALLAQAVGKEPEYTSTKSLPREAKISVVLNHISKFGKISTSQATKIFRGQPMSTTRGFLSDLSDKGILLRVVPSKNRASWFYVEGKKFPKKTRTS